MKIYSETFETNGIDYTYEIIHFLDTRNVMVQLIDDETGNTIPDSSYTATRNTNSTIILKLHNNPKKNSKFTILILGM